MTELMEKAGRIRMLFFDIDHTSFDHDLYDTPASTRKALKELHQGGYKLAICTSRTYEEMIHLPKDYLDAMDVIVCTTGARILKEINDSVLMKDGDDRRAIQWMDSRNLVYRYETSECHGYLNCDDPEISSIFQRLYHMVPPVKPYQGERLMQIMFYTRSSELLDQIIREFPDETLTLNGYANEMNAKGINKAEGMRRAAEAYGWNLEQTAAFGDDLNDICMLKAAGIGIAMGNGIESCRDAADYVTDRIEEDGLYHACVHFGWISKPD